MAKAIDQERYDRVFEVAMALVVVAEGDPDDIISGPIGHTLFALLNAWEREPSRIDELSKTMDAAEKLAEAYNILRMEAMVK